MKNVQIKETTQDDLANIMSLWNDGDVMQHVGFPNGLDIDSHGLEKWYLQISKNPAFKHFSVYDSELGYCGESCYSIDLEHRIGEMDIKLFSKARGKGIARFAFEHAIKEAFRTRKCDRVFVEPKLENKKAWALYETLGFVRQERPDYLEPNEVYLELTLEAYMKLRNNG